ncbi:MAG: DNA polymerase III subunit gamma/tau [Betaproteobacteria bacterium]|nr:DNA polymerase III subunit gamma/tau [Betaproteobacteria bacterium]
MSYQVLARKWRPRVFAELSGQEHVVQALTHALERGRMHHAYLLTGTRGVGKTTIARILAKSLNCATGVTATPCGACPACVDIDAGRFVDLLELDAASNTGIDNMREILDNARYAPTTGRYKVYLIDEVHMLSKAAFNSMLKTLEEPPEHVKFVLATTDPQKIPITVLSRCLQFNLKQLPPALIGERLRFILDAEGIAADASALALIARGAHGSMRDALSLLDQAIAYGAGEVRDAVVRSMLGTVDTDYAYRIVEALQAGDGAALLAECDAMTERSVAFAPALDELASLLHRIAVAQVVPAAAAAFDDAARVTDLAGRMAADEVQLAYQIVVQGRADLALAPDEAMGFSMTLLRLLAFRPDAGGESVPPREPTVAPARPPHRHGAGRHARGSGPGGARAAPSAVPPPMPAAAAPVAPRRVPQPAAPAAAPQRELRSLPLASADWPAFVADLKLTAIAAQLAAQTEFRSLAGNVLTLALPPTHKHLADRVYADKLKQALEETTGRKLLLAFEVGTAAEASLAARERREREEERARNETAFRAEPFVRDVLERFDATIRPDSIKPVS